MSGACHALLGFGMVRHCGAEQEFFSLYCNPILLNAVLLVVSFERFTANRKQSNRESTLTCFTANKA